VRLQAWSVWESLTFILNGLVFVLIGLQLPYVREGIHGYGMSKLIAYSAVFSAFLILLRLIWMYPGAYVANVIRRRLLHQDEPMPPTRNTFVLGWTGMRGVISLAAAISLPTTLGGGTAFSQRSLITFLAFSVILVTLVLQGLTLPPLIRKLGLAGATGTDGEEQEARRTILESAINYLETARKNDGSRFEAIYDDLEHHYRHRLAVINEDGDNDAYGLEDYRRHVQVSCDVLRVERQTAVKLRNQGRISDVFLRRVERELDLEEARLLEKQR
jgi:CPA1 family monovalent cation:H+ antiporter